MRHTRSPLDEQQGQLLERLRAAGGAPVSFDELRAVGIENPALLCYELAAVGFPVTRTCSPGEGMPALSVRLEPEREPRASVQEVSNSPEAIDAESAIRPRLPPRPRVPPRPRPHPRARVPPTAHEVRLPRVLGWLTRMPDTLRNGQRPVEVPLTGVLAWLTRASASLHQLREPLERSLAQSLAWLAAAGYWFEQRLRRAGSAVRHARPAALIAIGALAVTFLAVVAIVLGNQAGNDATRLRAANVRTHSDRKTISTRSAKAGQAVPATPPSASASGVLAQLASGARTRTSPTKAEALETEGHQLLAGGNYASAIRQLSAAIETSGQSLGSCTEPASEACLTFAYALYDLGRALRLEGHHSEAITILSERLRIDNQRPTVQHELELASGARA